jgi:hypothetical protein
MRPARSWPRWDAARPVTGAFRPPGEATLRACWPLSTPTPSTTPSAPGWPPAPYRPPGCRRHPPAAPGGRGRRQDPARQRPPPQVAGPPAVARHLRLRPHLRPRPRPGRDPPAPGHHRRRPGLPPRHPRPRNTSRARPLTGHQWRTVTVYAATSLATAQVHPARWPTGSAGPGASRRCTTSATPPSPSKPPRSTPAPPQGHGQPAQPGHRHPVRPRRPQPRSRAVSQRPRRHPDPATAGRHKPVHRHSSTLARRWRWMLISVPGWRIGPRSDRRPPSGSTLPGAKRASLCGGVHLSQAIGPSRS